MQRPMKWRMKIEQVVVGEEEEEEEGVLLKGWINAARMEECGWERGERREGGVEVGVEALAWMEVVVEEVEVR